MDPKCLLTLTDLQTRRARCQHQLSFLLVTSKFYAFLVVFHTFSPMFFSVLAGIIPLSLRNGGGGHLIPFAPMSASGGQLPPLPSRLRRLCDYGSLIAASFVFTDANHPLLWVRRS